MAIWPVQFCPLINSFQESPPDGIVRTSMDIGPAKIRRRTTANIRPISFKLFLKKDDVAVMDSFYLTYAADEFDFTHPRTKNSVKARFVEPPAYMNRSIGYEVSVSLEIMP